MGKKPVRSVRLTDLLDAAGAIDKNKLAEVEREIAALDNHVGEVTSTVDSHGSLLAAHQIMLDRHMAEINENSASQERVAKVLAEQQEAAKKAAEEAKKTSERGDNTRYGLYAVGGVFGVDLLVRGALFAFRMLRSSDED